MTTRLVFLALGTAAFFVVLRRRGHHVTGSLVIGMWLTALLGTLTHFNT